jgi:hypothetical protein
MNLQRLHQMSGFLLRILRKKNNWIFFRIVSVTFFDKVELVCSTFNLVQFGSLITTWCHLDWPTVNCSSKFKWF